MSDRHANHEGPGADVALSPVRHTARGRRDFRAFDREWAPALLERVVSRLRDECVAAERGPQVESLRLFLPAGTGARSYAGVATALGLEAAAARAAVLRLRKR